MAHFAQLDENNIVLQVIVVDNKDTSTEDGIELENLGVAFCKNLLGPHTNWKQTSYHGNMRKNYAGPGYFYDTGRDAFIPPRPFDSWTLHEDTCRWQAPVAYPQDGKLYRWNEPTLSWVEANV